MAREASADGLIDCTVSGFSTSHNFTSSRIQLRCRPDPDRRARRMSARMLQASPPRRRGNRSRSPTSTWFGEAPRSCERGRCATLDSACGHDGAGDGRQPPTSFSFVSWQHLDTGAARSVPASGADQPGTAAVTVFRTAPQNCRCSRLRAAGGEVDRRKETLLRDGRSRMKPCCRCPELSKMIWSPARPASTRARL